MRVIAGKARGLTLKTLEDDATRPTKDMVREALFNILGDKVRDCTFLDLFAGSGAVGIEAISRGARSSYFCDNSKDAVNIINSNIEKARFAEFAAVFQGDYSNVLHRLNDICFDIIFIDPPYNKGIGVKAIDEISNKNLLIDGGAIIYETDRDEDVPDVIGKYRRYDIRRYGRNILNMYT